MKSRRIFSAKKAAAILGLMVLTAVYLSVGLTPGSLRRAAILKIYDLTGKKVLYRKALWLPVEGFSLRDVRVFDKDNTPLFSAKKFSVNVRLLPFLTSKKIVLTDLQLDEPVYEVVFDRPPPPPAPALPMTKISGQLPVPVASDRKNISVEAIEQGPDYFLPENVYLEQIRIADGTVTFRAHAGDAPIEQMRGVQVRLGFAKPPVLTFDGSFGLTSDPDASVRLKGAWDLERSRYVFDFHTAASRVPPWLLAYQTGRFLVLRDGHLDFHTHLQSLDESRSLFKVSADLERARLDVKQTVLTGHMKLKAQGAFDFLDRRFLAYSGDLDLIDVDVANLSKDIPHLESLSGKVKFKPDLIEVKALTGNYRELAFNASATLRSFKDQNFNALISSRMDVSKALELVPEDKRKLLSGVEITGACEAVTELSGSLKHASDMAKIYHLVLKDGLVNIPAQRLRLEHVFADLGSAREGVRIRDARFESAGVPYRVNAFIPSSPDEAGSMDIRSPRLDLTARYRLSGDSAAIQEATIRIGPLSASLHGTLEPLSKLHLKAQGEARLSLERLPVKDLGLSGTLSGPFTYSGSAAEPLLAEMQIDAKGSGIRVRNKYRLDAVSLQLRGSGGAMHIPYLHAAAYGGSLNANGVVDFRQSRHPFDIKFMAHTIDLAALSPDAGAKDLAGILSLDGALRGLMDDSSSFEGAGTLEVRDGRLWETDQFKEMGQLPFFIRVEGLDRVIFKELTAGFAVHDRRFWSEDLRLRSDTVDLALKGSAGFDQTLDFLMDIRYSEGVIRGAFQTGGLVPVVVQNAEGLISQYRISGTLKEPKYDKVGLAPSLGRRITGILGLTQ